MSSKDILQFSINFVLKHIKMNRYMKYRKSCLTAAMLLLIVVVGPGKLAAQYDAMFTQYMNNETFINPAYTGTKEALSLTALHRQQWVGFKGRPITTTFTAHAPLQENQMGVGISLLNEKIGALERNLIYGSYSYRVRLNETDKLSFGLMAGVHLQLNKLGEVKTIKTGDPEFAVNTPTVATPNFGFGTFYYNDKFYAGFSIPRLVDDNVQVNSNGDVLKNVSVNLNSFHYYFTTGRVFDINPELKLKPQLMFKVVRGAPAQMDINVNALVSDRLWFGAGYRSGADMSAMTGIMITPQMLLGYSYDFPLTRLNKHTGGSHEFSLSYLFNYGAKKIVSARYF